MKLNGARILCECLLREGVDTIFGFPGGQVVPLYDVLPEYPGLRHVLVRHEQAAAHAADGYARATGRPGVCLATSGPGATNLVTGLATAHLDSSPVIAITGQVPTRQIGRDSFQEVDITGITLPITKHNYLVLHEDDIASTVKTAFYLARTGRPGPVLIDLPKDVQENETNFRYPKSVSLPGYRPTIRGHGGMVKRAAELINKASRPLIIAGRGVILSQACEQLLQLAVRAEIPVITTLMGVGSFPGQHRLAYGLLGMHGMPCANFAVNHADVIIALGTRFSDRSTGRPSEFGVQAQIVHVDVDPAEIGKNKEVKIPIVGDIRTVLAALEPLLVPTQHRDWLAQLDEWREQFPLAVPETADLLPQQVIQTIYAAMPDEATVVTDVGQNQLWAAQYYRGCRPNGFITSGGLGTMGFGLPAAMGVKVGRPHDMVWAIVGDGGFQMNMQELTTLVQDNIAVKIAILNNGFLGMVRQWQELFYQRNYSATPLIGPNFAAIAKACGVPALTVRDRTDVETAVGAALDCSGPFLIDFQVAPEENVYPMVPPGKSLKEMIMGPAASAGLAAGARRLLPQ